jgi:hypothetical protein
MEKILSADFNIDDLGLNFESQGFGPYGAEYDFTDRFDGKIFKPYPKKERLGKLCEFVGFGSTYQSYA